MLRDLVNLEMHIVHSCNLACESCSHYSNQGHTGRLSFEQADHWMSLWNNKLNPRVFTLLGGEPTLHPQLKNLVVLARKKWPRAHLRLVTNGFFLHRHPDLPAILGSDPDACIYLSIHHGSDEYQAALKPVLELLNQWCQVYGVNVKLDESYKNWTRRYQTSGRAIMPFEDGQPRSSWKKCLAKHCPQLFRGKIWKCAPLAYLPLQNEKYKLDEKWTPYLGYQALEPDCSMEDLDRFFDLKAESYCSMCPANPEKFNLPFPANYSARRTES